MNTGYARVAAALAAAALGALAGGVLLAGAATAESDPPQPAGTSAGTSFLTAVPVRFDQPLSVDASTGDYLYWSFPARAGETATVTISVVLPPPADRSGPQEWTVDVFDGLRRRQACVRGVQSPLAPANAPSVRLGCELREVRSWAEPWSGDPLPGTYYVRLSATDLPERDLGLPITVEGRITATGSGDPAPEGGTLATPLAPAVKAGTVTSQGPTASPSPSEDPILATDWLTTDWLPAPSSRWGWTAAGGIVAAIAGVGGFALTRRRSRRGTTR